MGLSSKEVRGAALGDQPNIRNEGTLAAAKTMSMNPLSVKDKPNFKAITDWKMAITVYHTNTRTSWGEVSRKLESIIKRKFRVFQVIANKATLLVLGSARVQWFVVETWSLNRY